MSATVMSPLPLKSAAQEGGAWRSYAPMSTTGEPPMPESARLGSLLRRGRPFRSVSMAIEYVLEPASLTGDPGAGMA